MKQNYFALVAMLALAIFSFSHFTRQTVAAPTDFNSAQTLENTNSAVVAPVATDFNSAQTLENTNSAVVAPVELNNLDSVQTLEQLGVWLETNPPQIIPLTDATTQQYLAEAIVTLRNSVNKLNMYLKENGTIGQKWEALLAMNSLNQALAQPIPDLNILVEINQKFHSHQWGLEILELKTVTKALDDYIILRMIIEEKTDPQAGLQEATQRLIAILKSPDKISYTATHELNFILNWLQQYRQAPEVCKTLKRLSEKNNVYAHLSDKFVLKFLDAPVDQTDQVNDYIAGNQQIGLARTIGRTSGVFNPDPHRINMSVKLNANIKGNTSTQTRGVAVYSTSNNKIFVIKDIFFDGNLFTTTAARSSSKVNSQITGIQAPGLLTTAIANNRAYETKPQAEAEAQYLARVRAEDAVNSTVVALLNNTNERFKEKSELYRARGLFPKPLLCSTTKDHIIVQGLIKGAQPLVAVPHPVPPANTDLFISIHQSSLTEIARTLLSDLKADKRVFLTIAHCMMSEEQFCKLCANMQKEEEKQKQENREIPTGFIYFNKDNPVDFTFDNNTLKMLIRIDGFQGEKSDEPQEIPMNILVEYKISTVDNTGIHLNRVGSIQFVPRDFETGASRKLTPTETTIRVRLMDSLQQTFPEEYVLKPGNLNSMIRDDSPLKSTMTGTLQPIVAEAKDGWLSLGWQVVQ